MARNASFTDLFRGRSVSITVLGVVISSKRSFTCKYKSKVRFMAAWRFWPLCWKSLRSAVVSEHLHSSTFHGCCRSPANSITLCSWYLRENVRPSKKIKRWGVFRRRYAAVCSMIPMQKSSCSAEYSTSRFSNSVCRTISLLMKVPLRSFASLEARALFPVPGRPAMMTIIRVI